MARFLLGRVAQTLLSMLVVISIEVLALTVVLILAGNVFDLDAVFQIIGPWVLTALGVGLVSARLRSITSSISSRHWRKDRTSGPPSS